MSLAARVPPETYFWSDLPGYRADVVLQDDGLYYWHLFRWAQRVNGGLSENPYHARQDAGLAAFRDSVQHWEEDRVLRRYRYPGGDSDDEYERWEPGRGALDHVRISDDTVQVRTGR